MRVSIRDYVEQDRDACMAVFDSNVPDYFGAHERSLFESYLSVLRDTYLVIQDGAEIVACGGVGPHPREADAAKLEWGMVLKSRHKTGLGRRLLVERLDRRLNRYPTARIVFLNTSQFSAGFFAEMGFETQRVTPDGYFAGMDKHEMSARLPLQLL